VKDATTDAEQIRRWWSEWPTANVGIATGRESGLVVLDVDADKGGELSLETLCANGNALPNTVETITGGGGRHIWFSHPGGVIRNAVEL